uniref:KIB1-4 beta-propeller domain-containing protein n=1 Tax=Hordeum vulgare subsp. vulgare TaxID=112509 RepID=A0A8I7B4D0_HORVV
MSSPAGKCERPPAPITAASATCSGDMFPLASMPADLLELIGWRVLAGDLLDYMRFRAVCAHSRSSTINPRGLAITDSRFHPRRWMMLPAGHRLHLEDGRKRFLNLDTGVFVRPQVPLLDDHCVLCSVDGLLLMQRQHCDQDAQISLLHPFTGDVAKFPPITYPMVVNLFGSTSHLYSNNGYAYLLPGKVTASLTVNADEGVAMITIVLQDAARVLFATTKDKQWRLSAWRFSPKESNISSQGKIYMFQPKPRSSVEQRILQIDPPRPENIYGSSSSLFPAPKVIAIFPTGTRNALFELVECDSEILLIDSSEYILTKRMAVYRISDLIQGRVTPLTSIGDKALLVGVSTSGSVIGRNLSVSLKAMPTIGADMIVCQDPIHGKYLGQYHIGSGTWSLRDMVCDIYSVYGCCTCSLIDHMYGACHCFIS